MPARIPVKSEIRLDQFLKWARVAESGGQAKNLIVAGRVEVNGEVETRRGRIIREGDRVRVNGREYAAASFSGGEH